MAAMALLPIVQGILTKSKDSKKPKPKDKQDDWQTGALWKPTPAEISWRKDTRVQVAQLSMATSGLTSAAANQAKDSVGNAVKANDMRVSRNITSNQTLNIQTPNIRSFKANERQLAATSQNSAVNNRARLG
jgi:hypothetical protein